MVAFVSALGLMLVLFAAAVALTVRAGEWRGMGQFWNGREKFSVTAFMLGMVPGFVFGIVDQMALWAPLLSEPTSLSNALGSVLEPIFPMGVLTKQGWGNLVSGGVGTFCSVMVGKIVTVLSGRCDFPIHSDIAGVVAGGIAGIYIPRLITGRA